MIYTPELIKSIAPAVFATSPSPKMTNKYEFVPTNEVMEMFDREGWQISSVKQTGRGLHAVHELKYRNGQLPKVGDTVVEAIIRNSHNGSATFSMGAGLFRLVCSNGLTVPTSVAERFSVRHNHFSLDEVKGLADAFSKKLPMIETSVSKMMEKELSEEEKTNILKTARLTGLINIKENTNKLLGVMGYEPDSHISIHEQFLIKHPYILK